MIFTWLVVLSSFSIVWLSVPPVEADDLVSVVVLYRHGDRGISRTFPTDPYKDPSYWPYGIGEILPKGKRRLFYLGQWLKNRYSGFLAPSYKKSDIRIYSSDQDRSLMSAASALAGMYMVKNEHQWLSGLPWEPIPIHTTPEPKDPILAVKSICPKRDKLIEEQLESKYFTDIVKDNAALFRYLSEKTGWNMTNVHFVQTLHSIMYIYQEHNETYIPDWYRVLNQTHIEYLAGVSFSRRTRTLELKKFLTGPFLNLLFNYFDEIITRKEGTPKFLMFAAHDIIFVALLCVMDHYDFRPPEFAATLIWEMYKNSTSNAHYLKMYYKKYYWPGLELFTLKECEENCLYSTYRKVLGPLSISSATWENECYKDL